MILESPFRASSGSECAENVSYALACLRDCLRRGEAPFASHVLYAASGALDDDDSEQRRLGIEAGLAWGAVAEATVVYTDRGVSDGMWQGIQRACDEGRPVEFRRLEA